MNWPESKVEVGWSKQMLSWIDWSIGQAKWTQAEIEPIWRMPKVKLIFGINRRSSKFSI